MIHHIIATIGLFIGIMEIFMFWGNSIVKYKPDTFDIFVSTIGWTTFIAAMWIF